MHKDVQKIILTEKQIQAKIQELAKRINADYKNKDLVLIVILRGAAMFLADLSKQINVPHTIDFIVATRYGYHDAPRGEVKLIKDLDQSISGKNILIIEDIVDNGCTIKYIYDHLKQRGPKSLKICTLFDKPYNRKIKIKLDYTGFLVQEEFVVGYGLDYKQKYRNLPYLAILKPEIYKN